MDDSIKFS